MLRFKFGTTKKIQAAAVLLKLAHGRMDVLRLLKLLYIADRESLAERGCPIVGGRVCALDHGPLHSEIYDMIKGEGLSEAAWSEAFDKEGYEVVLKRDPGRDELSPFEIEKLTAVTEQFFFESTYHVAEHTHEFQEWIESHVAGTSRTIPLERILATLGFTDDEISDIRNDAEHHAKSSRLLKS